MSTLAQMLAAAESDPALATDPAYLAALDDLRCESDPAEASARDLEAVILRASGYDFESAVERFFGWPSGAARKPFGGIPYKAWNQTYRDYARGLVKWAAEVSARPANRRALLEMRSRQAGGTTAANAREQRRRDLKDAEAARRGLTIGERAKLVARHTEVVTGEPGGRRLRVRYCSASSAAADARAKALETGKWRAVCRNGGDVCNTYGYRAETEGVLAIASPTGRVVVFHVRLPANKVTAGGVAGACWSVARPLFDSRYGAGSRADAWKDIKRTFALLPAFEM